jgi:uncharacterized protein YbjT (DUF2867 family)
VSGPAFVAGATGYAGRALVGRLAAAAEPVVAHVRPDSRVGPDVLEAFTRAGARVDRTPWEPEAMRRALAEVAPSRIFVLLGTTRRRTAAARRRGERAGYAEVDRDLPLLLVDAAIRAGVTPTLAYLSALGADPDSRNAYLRARGAVERAIAAAPMPWVILRPSFVTGPDRREPRPAERLAAKAVDGVLGALGALGWKAPASRYGSLDAEAVARALDTLSRDPSARGRIIEGSALREAAGIRRGPPSDQPDGGPRPGP